jgi:D-tyrosyl-tRNA(Tyr) deacylase
VGKTGLGFLVLVGLEKDDTRAQVERAATRVVSLRVFDDEDGKMNRGLDEVGGAVLAVSQFTLAGSIKKGRRPGFDKAMPGEEAEPLFNYFVDMIRTAGIAVETGVFGAMMDVELVNSGPVTLLWNDPE